MDYLAPDRVIPNLRRTYRGRGHWLFFFDQSGRGPLAMLVCGLPLVHVDPSRVQLGEFAWADRTGQGGTVTWLAVPKPTLPWQTIADYVAALGLPGPARGRACDLFMVSTDPDRLARAVASVIEGRGYIVNPSSN